MLLFFWRANFAFDLLQILIWFSVSSKMVVFLIWEQSEKFRDFKKSFTISSSDPENVTSDIRRLFHLRSRTISVKFSGNAKEKDSRSVDGNPPGPQTQRRPQTIPMFYRLGWVLSLRVCDEASGRVLSQGLKVLWQMQTWWWVKHQEPLGWNVCRQIPKLSLCVWRTVVLLFLDLLHTSPQFHTRSKKGDGCNPEIKFPYGIVLAVPAKNSELVLLEPLHSEDPYF